MADKEYIEREAALKLLAPYDGVGEIWIEIDVVAEGLHNLPTADVVEVRHGEWVKVDDLCGIDVLRCSVCGAEHPRVATAYCCDCGAKMDGKGEPE